MENSINEGCLAMVDMRDDGNVSNVRDGGGILKMGCKDSKLKARFR